VKNLVSRLPKTVNRVYFPIFLILIANLIIGLFTFQDYGLSWDEPLFYQYADAVPYAYSISARMNGDFDIEKAYGPSAEDHKIYGPIYLLLAKPAVDLLDWMLPIPRADLWHLVNFVTFQVGVVLFFALCLRWMNSWSAFGASLLFSTQPIIWGHSWINPKDIPFTVFFLAAVYFGYKMVDALSDLTVDASAALSFNNDASAKRWRKWRIILQILAIFFIVTSLASFIFYAQIQGLVRDLIHNAYLATPDSLLGTLFGSLAVNAQSIPESAYINKGLLLLSRMKISLAILAVILLIPAIVLTFWMPFIQQKYHGLVEALSPLPAKPEWWWSRVSSWRVLHKVLLAGILLGLVVSIRVIGPLAGVLVCLYFIFKPGRHSLAGMVIYFISAMLALYFAWPYLWSSPLAHFVDVLQHMSHNPKVLPVLYNGMVTPSDKLPMTYLPVMLGITLTWPMWPLFITGLLVFWSRIKSRGVDWRSLTPIVLWFLVPFLYVLMIRPPMYDGYRHFLFLLPPVFILSGLTIQAIWERLRNTWSFALTLIVLIVPGVIGLVRLHPYEYTYYNLLVGDTGGAFRRYETDFWLTCYKELMAQVDEEVSPGTTLFVHRQPSIAQEYASPEIIIDRFDPQDDRTFPGSLLLLTTRANVDLSLHPEAPEILSVGREGASFCLVKDIP
jgi:hypothetical protein